ncbi:MAG: acetylesterase [Holdemanella sp.]|nr:acetylesterase [Holdemanella sp.]
MALVKVDFFSESLMRTVTINAIVPVDKLTFPGMPKREDKPFKTLYLLHGIFGNYIDWVDGTRIERWATDNNLVVIMPSGENKFYVDNEKSGDLFSQFIGKELVEVTRKLFPLSTKYEDTYIAGLSMGGYGSIINGLRFNETFSHISLLSAALILDAVYVSNNDAPLTISKKDYYEAVFGPVELIKGSYKDYYAAALNVKKKPKIYMCCGTEDGLYKPNEEYYTYLKENGYDVTFEYGPGNHDWVFWDTYIQKVLEWLPLETKNDSIHSGNVGID